jgi:hypothetical protein
MGQLGDTPGHTQGDGGQEEGDADRVPGICCDGIDSEENCHCHCGTSKDKVSQVAGPVQDHRPDGVAADDAETIDRVQHGSQPVVAQLGAQERQDRGDIGQLDGSRVQGALSQQGAVPMDIDAAWAGCVMEVTVWWCAGDGYRPADVVSTLRRVLGV